jgi:hypothetical protein
MQSPQSESTPRRLTLLPLLIILTFMNFFTFYVGTGPIRTKHRKDTSPYGSERLSISNAPGGSSSHLSPPDTSGAWRRVRSDPFLATHARSNSGSSTGVSPAGSVTDAPTAVQDSNGGISPLHGASPTMQRRGTGITCLNVSACLSPFFTAK